MKHLSKEEVRKLHLDIAAKGSWLCKTFQDEKLSVEDKQEILRRVMDKLKKKEAA